MSSLFQDKWFRALVIWTGVWQLGHLLLNIQYCFGSVDFPLPPPEGWSGQAPRIFDGLVASDLLQSTVALIATAGYFARRRWSLVLGLVALASSAFNSLSFTYFVVATGAWAPNASHYWGIQILWAPLMIQLVWLCKHLSQPEARTEAEASLAHFPADSRA